MNNLLDSPAKNKLNYISKMVSKIRSYDEIKNGDLETTIISFVDNGFCLSATARDLSVNRKTIKNRMDCLGNICGSDILSGENFVRVYLELIDNAR